MHPLLLHPFCLFSGCRLVCVFAGLVSIWGVALHNPLSKQCYNKNKAGGKMFSGKSFINAYILSFVDHFHLIHPGNGQPGALLWRTSHPVDRCRQRACPVGFDTNILACFVQTVDQRVVYPERRFSAGEDNGCSRIFADFGYDFVVRHQSALFVLRVAETAFQVTAGEADKKQPVFRYDSLPPANYKKISLIFLIFQKSFVWCAFTLSRLRYGLSRR